MPALGSARGDCLAPLGLQAPQVLRECPSMTAMRLWSLADLDYQDSKVCRGLQDQRVTKERWAHLGLQGSSPSTSSSWEQK